MAKTHQVRCVVPSGDRVGEGAVWSAQDQSVYWTDINRFLIHAHDTRTGATRSWCFDEPVVALSLSTEEGRWLVALASRLVWWWPALGLGFFVLASAYGVGSAFKPTAFGLLLSLALLPVLFGTVFAAVYHSEVIAVRVGEPYGTLMLTASVTVIEVALIVTLMVTSEKDTATLARDTVFAAVMITLNGIVGLALVVGALRHHLAVFNAEGSGSSLATVATLAGLTLVLPTFGTWHQIAGAPITGQTADLFNPKKFGPNASGLYTVQVALGTFPDATMGAGTDVLLYHFAVYLTATPLVGEPTVLLTKNICVDLNASTAGAPVGSIGPAPNTTNDFEVIFGPDGKLVNAPSGQLFLLVRDYTKGADFRVPPGAQLIDAFRRAGETHLVTIRSTGAIGYAPVTWPDNATGMYSGSGQDPFTLARQDSN